MPGAGRLAAPGVCVTNIVGWCKGNISAAEAEAGGSNPSPATKNSEEIVKEICGYVSKITKITTKQTKILTWGLWLTTEIFIKNPETLEKVRTMSTLKGQSINEKLHNREIELRQKGKQEGIQEEKTNMKNTIKTLENEGKTSDEILKTLKTTF
mgnify:CR=1 FL=1